MTANSCYWSFTSTLLSYPSSTCARQRLQHDRTVRFYLSSVYFSLEEIEVLLSFIGRDGLTLEQSIQTTLACKLQQARDVEASSYDICTSHDLALILRDHFSIRKGFQDESGYKNANKKFNKAWKKQSKAHE